MKWKRLFIGIGLAGWLICFCGCIKTVTGQYDNFRADQLYAENQRRQAFELYYQSAQKGVAESQYMVSQMLLLGDGVTANTSEGLRWLEMAAQQDHAEAARDLGLCLLNGEFGGSQDTRRGVWFLERAAAGGDSLSMMTLGYLYGTGYGVARNPQTAAYWYGQAAQYGEWVPTQWQDADYLAAIGKMVPYNAKAEYHQRVKRAQTGLKALGYYKSGVDGIAGPGTAAAVRQFQKDQRIEVNGRIDMTLMRHLYRRIVFEPLNRLM